MPVISARLVMVPLKVRYTGQEPPEHPITGALDQWQSAQLRAGPAVGSCGHRLMQAAVPTLHVADVTHAVDARYGHLWKTLETRRIGRTNGWALPTIPFRIRDRPCQHRWGRLRSPLLRADSEHRVARRSRRHFSARNGRPTRTRRKIGRRP